MKRDESRSETDFGALAGLNGLGAHAKTAQNCAISKPYSGMVFNFQLDSGGGQPTGIQLSLGLNRLIYIVRIFGSNP